MMGSFFEVDTEKSIRGKRSKLSANIVIILYNSKIKLNFYDCQNLNLSDFKIEQSH